MIKRDFKTEAIIRDSKILKIELQFESFSKDSKIEKCVTISFLKNENEQIELTLINPQKFDIFDNECSGDYVGNIKVLEENGIITFCFDPYDKSIDGIQDEDNYLFLCGDFTIS